MCAVGSIYRVTGWRERPAQGSLRVMPNCFAMGQAAGVAAAMARAANQGFREVPIAELQRK
jgi:hypothetical protein